MPDPAWVALSLLRHVGGKTLRALMDYFDGDVQAVLRADTKTLMQVHGVGQKIAQAIHDLEVEPVARQMQAWQRAGVHILTRDDALYPPALHDLEDEPPTLFLRGDIQPHLWDRGVAIVGTRIPQTELAVVAHRLGARLSREGWTVVSGLAYGIDAATHRGVLGVDGRAVAVLGSGVLRVYPREHVRLAESILENGLLMSEIHPHANVNTPALVARNRIISGLCRALIVVQTEEDGGAMHAARRAVEQGRTVYALDIPASGNRRLIEQGATPIDIELRDLNLEV